MRNSSAHSVLCSNRGNTGFDRLRAARPGGDPTCGHTCVARRRDQLGMPKQSLDQPDIGATLEQMRGKAVAQRMQTDALPDAGRVRRLMEQAAELARR